MLSSLHLMQLRLENNLLHFVNYEKKEKKKEMAKTNNLKSTTSANLEKILEYLTI